MRNLKQTIIFMNKAHSYTTFEQDKQDPQLPTFKGIPNSKSTSQRTGNLISGHIPKVRWNSIKIKSKTIEKCSICTNQVPTEELLLFSQKCNHSLCFICQQKKVNNQIGWDDRLKCPYQGCHEVLKQQSKIYQRLSTEKKQLFSGQSTFQTISYQIKKKMKEQIKMPYSDKLIYNSAGRAKNDDDMSHLLTRINQKLNKKRSRTTSTRGIATDRKMIELDMSENTAMPKNARIKAQNPIPRKTTLQLEEGLLPLQSIPGSNGQKSCPEVKQEMSRTAVLQKVESRHEITDFGMIDVNLPEESFWPEKARKKIESANNSNLESEKKYYSSNFLTPSHVTRKLDFNDISRDFKEMENQLPRRASEQKKEQSLGDKVRRLFCMSKID